MQYDDDLIWDDEDTQTTVKIPVDTLQIEDIPNLPESLSPENYRMLLPKGLESEATIELDGNTIVITCLRPENTEYTKVMIRPALYNSEGASTVVPRFLFEQSTVTKDSINYFGADKKKYILNINQFLYKLISDRLNAFKSHKRQFVYLLQQDITNLSKYIEYVLPVAYNAAAKTKNTYVVVPAWAHQKVFPWGNFFNDCRVKEEDWNSILVDLAPYLQPSSESSMHKQSKVTLSEKPIYRSVGYIPTNDGTGDFYSIFESKQNLAARLKTHYLGDAKRVVDPDISVFQQDCIVVMKDGMPVLMPKDSTFKKAIVVFAPIERDTKRFIAGEAEISANIADTLVVNTDSVTVGFTSREGERMPKHVLDVVRPVKKDEEVLLGYDEDFQPVTLPRGVLTYKITKLAQTSASGLTKLYFEAVMKAGNARIITNTGLKFVSKVLTNLGRIYMPKLETFSEERPKFSPSTLQYLKNADENELVAYKKIDVDKLDINNMTVLEPDLILGMNAVKATTSDQSNSIVLAQAALAVELGYYVPKTKFGFPRLLNTGDVKEINEAAKALPEFFYIDRNGQRQKVLIGLSYLNFTELGSVYTRFKPQSFAFTSGKNIFQNMPELAMHIYQNYLEEDKVAIAKEFYKILNDPRGLLRAEEKLPMYTVEQLRKHKIFNEDDMILQKINTSSDRSDSKLLDEEWNKNGFYLNFVPNGGPLIRIPSAKTLQHFVSHLPDGGYSFHGLIINISKIIKHVVGTQSDNFKQNLGYIFKKGVPLAPDHFNAYALYMKSIQGALYSNEDSAMMIIQSLIKPKINGLGMKQVVEPLLPDDVIVITDTNKYKRLAEQCFTEEQYKQHLENLNSVLDQDYDPLLEDVFNFAFDDEMSNEDVDRILNDVPLALAIRDPSLWEMQLQKVRVWDRKRLALYLSRCENPMDLDDYLSPHHNRDICLVSSKVALASKSDCDGDRLPIFVLNQEGQEILKRFELNNVLPDELNWINTYIAKEYGSTAKLHIDNPEKHVYKLFRISMQFDPKGNTKTYPHYLFNAQIAKGNIGPATIDMWALYMIIETYMAYFKKFEGKRIKNGKVVGKLQQSLIDYDKKFLSFKQTELVQGNVIEAVKHMEGGSSAFKKYFLDGMTDDKNKDIVRKELITPYKQGGYNMQEEDADRMLYVVKWSAETKLLKAVKNFITKYNKGKLPKDPTELNEWETFIQENTYFGGLIKPIFDIKNEIEELSKQAALKRKAKAEEEARKKNDVNDGFLDFSLLN